MFWKSVILFLSGLCLASAVQAQPDTLWTRTFGGNGEDMCYSVVQTLDNGFSLAGMIESRRDSVTSYWLVSADENGNERWANSYGDQRENACYRHLQTQDSGLVLVGWSGSMEGENRFTDKLIIKTNNEGDTIWTRTIDRYPFDYAYDVIETPEGNIGVVGLSDFIMFDEAGEELWFQRIGVGAVINSVIKTQSGGFALISSELDNVGRDMNLYLTLTDGNGAILSRHRFGGPENDYGYSLAQSQDRGYFLAGATESFGAGQLDIWLIRVNPEGDSLWSKTFGSENQEWCNDLIITSYGTLVLAGTKNIIAINDANFWMVSTTIEGDSLWSCTFGGRQAEVCNSVIQTLDGGYALAGYTKSFGAGDADFWLVKTGPDPVSVSNDGSVPYPSTLNLLSPYPNPFNNSVSVGFRTARAGLYALEVIDPQGRSLGVISKGYQTAGDFRMIWRADGLPGGNYWLRLTDARGGQDVKPIVLVK